MKHIFLDRCLFFPSKKILVVGDLHIGYEAQLRQSGVLIPERQINDLIRDLKKIFTEIKSKGSEIRKIIFLGDIKHSFSFSRKEAREFDKVIEFLGDYLPSENIIFLKGNHDTVDYSYESTMKNYYIEDELAFIHGHKSYKSVFDKSVKTIVMGHIHPSIILSKGVKTEKYKCFLEGKFKGKEIIILPSFLDFVEGQPVNNYENYYSDNFSIIPKKSLVKFRVHAIGKDKVFDFGKVKDLD